jgi:shikimate dehydrogenase
MKLNEIITGRTKLLGLIGNPIEHTISPQLHNTLSTMLGIDMVYIPFKVGKDSLEDAVKGFKACNLLGFNVTIPFKEEIIKYVDECTSEVKLMGCANTIKSTDGRLFAYNTDAEGFARSFEEETGTDFKDKNVLLLGAGGTARSLAIKIAAKGAKKLYLINRTIEKAYGIAELINRNICAVAEAASFNEMAEGILEKSDIIVNTTPLGMHPNINGNPVGDTIKFNSRQIVYDVIYNPVKTKLIKQAEAFGCKTVNGLGMLFYQGILAYEIWMDIKLPQPVLKELFEEFTNYLDK